MTALSQLPAWLPELTQHWAAEEGVQAVFLTGSFARGDANEFSDLDVQLLVVDGSSVSGHTTYHEGLLLSVDRSELSHRERALTDPDTALWNLVALQTGLPLHDPAGVFAVLQAKARALEWATLAPEAHRQAARRIAGSAEELHKIMGGLNAGDAGKVAYAALGLTFALGQAALLSTGTLIPTENRWLTLARDAWPDPVWHESFSCLAGLGTDSPEARGRAALTTYARAVALAQWPQDSGPEQRDYAVAQEAASRGAAFLSRVVP
ncbi:nucleotidyltransferase domain-containing protein [Deinococcus sp. QL22]|uniref:nucleotidyltransferase domain-containing protein n=1 Tax=Deinococcus sp. QL22 TaxID=2939437 RepID=UPI00201782C5|nr:nucleotidyltransferase domain-containing protein [Deinococcus sp. QL22]UQN07128.1 nucleotidyltransferase domain-containing protein [Deinococcus sp. QL22]